MFLVVLLNAHGHVENYKRGEERRDRICASMFILSNFGSEELTHPCAACTALYTFNFSSQLRSDIEAKLHF
jgi:hypothetical protein